MDHDAAETIRTEARDLGFRRVRFGSAHGAPGLAEFDRFITEKRHGTMAYLARGREPRADPQVLLPGALSVVTLGVDYAWPRPPDPGGLTGRVACYAWGRDYHNLIAKRIRRLARRIRVRRPDIEMYWGVDTRPFIERAWAERTGLGYVGKNCCSIVPGETSYLFLAVMLVTAALPADNPLADHCGTCRRCLDICPTDAFTAAGELDARRCISYLTIEHRGEIPESMRPAMGRWVFGCDECQEVCPHNHAPPTELEADFAPRPGNAWLDLPAILEMPDAEFAERFRGSALRRAGALGLKRNAAIVLGNIGDPAARPALEHALRHTDPVVQSHARWALDRL